MAAPRLTSILIGAPVCRCPSVLRIFLDGLANLDLAGIAPTWMLVDDNDDAASSALLASWRPPKGAYWACRAMQRPSQPFVCNENGHHWEPEQWWRVAAFKDQMLERARAENVDACFLVDSDLVLPPMVLQTLLAADKDIAIEVFWTRVTHSSGPEYQAPNVWAGGDARWWFKRPAEYAPSPEEADIRSAAWLQMLHNPGLYRVGGGGACTLIGRRALYASGTPDGKLAFGQMNSLDYAGEDRCFATRAEVLGLEVWADTHCPPAHLYRPSEVQSWLNGEGAVACPA